MTTRPTFTPLILILLIHLLVASGCSNNDKDPVKNPTVEDALADLGRSGAIPSLDQGEDAAGQDLDGNGLRDDVAVVIEALSDSPEQKTALSKTASALQLISLLPSTPGDNELRAVHVAIGAAVSCLSSVYEIREAQSKLETIRGLQFNTAQRAARYESFNENSDGMSITLPAESDCNE